MSLEDKISSQDSLLDKLKYLERPLVVTNGVFDVLHRGHVSYLSRAAELGRTLVVALNSDSSARLLGKGPDRPLNAAEDRAYVLAGLSSVDLVTFFDEHTPVKIIRSLRPDIYVKGGDYDMTKLEETGIVRSWGGKAVALPFIEGFSTTSLVNRIKQPYLQQNRKAAFLDRDGVINYDKGYVHCWKDFEFLPGAIDAMRGLQEEGYSLVIITNQSGIARGYYTENQYQRLMDAVRDHLANQGVNLVGIYHCPHHPKGAVSELSFACSCRKPAPGLLIRASQELGINLNGSIMVGDKFSDIQAARLAGVGSAYLVKTNNTESESEISNADGYFSSLLDCVSSIIPTKINGDKYNYK